MNDYNDACGCAARKAAIGNAISTLRDKIMATRGDIKTQQEKLKIKAELLAQKVKAMETSDKVKELQNRLRRMGGR